MGYEAFKTHVNALIDRAGGGIGVNFSEDTEKGKFTASCSDGTVITANQSCLKVTVRFGSHQAMATI